MKKNKKACFDSFVPIFFLKHTFITQTHTHQNSFVKFIDRARPAIKTLFFKSWTRTRIMDEKKNEDFHSSKKRKKKKNENTEKKNENLSFTWPVMNLKISFLFLFLTWPYFIDDYILFRSFCFDLFGSGRFYPDLQGGSSLFFKIFAKLAIHTSTIKNRIYL